jgi:hypothetical protein
LVLARICEALEIEAYELFKWLDWVVWFIKQIYLKVQRTILKDLNSK